MSNCKKTHMLLSVVLAIFLLITLGTPAYAFDAAGPSQNIIAAGGNHAGMVDENGSLWMWGDNSYGQLGNGGTTSTNVPVKIMDDVVSVSASEYVNGNLPRTITSAAIKSDGSLWTWGVADSENVLNVLGNGDKGNAIVEGNSGYGIQIAIQNKPVKILDNVASVSIGGWCGLAIQKNGSLWAWGNMGGDANNGFESNVPVKVMDGVVSACAGPQCAAAIKTDGSLWLWGYDLTADDGWPISKTPTKVMDSVAEVSIGCAAGSGAFAYIAAVKTDSSLWMWGTDWGALGLPEEEDTLFTRDPVKMMDGVAHVSAGTGNVAVVKTDGSLWLWGDNYSGQLGNGTREGSTSPVKAMENVSSVSVGKSATAGNKFILAVKKDGTVWSWGINSNGELGNGGKGNVTEEQDLGDYGVYKWVYQTIPTQVPGLKAKTTQMSQSAQSNLSFSDVQPGAYYYDAVDWAVQKGITTGTSAAAFSPNATCTRAQIITFLWRAAGSPEPTELASINDVASSDYYYKAVLWAVENGMISGSEFSPNSPCTRAIAVEFMWKQAESPVSEQVAEFTDVARSDSCAEAVSWAVDKGITSGTSGTTFSPDAACTRAQIVTFLYRANS